MVHTAVMYHYIICISGKSHSIWRVWPNDFWPMAKERRPQVGALPVLRGTTRFSLLLLVWYLSLVLFYHNDEIIVVKQGNNTGSVTQHVNKAMCLIQQVHSVKCLDGAAMDYILNDSKCAVANIGTNLMVLPYTNTKCAVANTGTTFGRWPCDNIYLLT